jgi:hypothetical protein
MIPRHRALFFVIWFVTIIGCARPHATRFETYMKRMRAATEAQRHDA